MKKLKIRVFSSGNLSGEGYLGTLAGGTVGKTVDSTVISPSVQGKIRIRKNLRGGLSVKCAKNSIREASVDGVSIDRHILKKLGVLREGIKRESCSLPSQSLVKLIFDGFDIIISEDAYVSERVTEEIAVTPLSGEFKRRPFAGDMGFLLILTASVICYTALHTTVLLTKAPKINVRKDIPRRFTRFIYDAPPPVVKTIEREMPQLKEKKADKEKVKEEKVAKKTETPVDTVKTEKPPSVDRNKIREKIARKGILGVLTGKGRAGSRYSENILNRMDEVSRIDVKVANLENIESPIGKEESAFVDSNISSLIEESELGSEKKFETRVYKMETGADMEISGDIEDKDRSAQIISSVISSYLGGIKYVYNRELKNNPNLSGKITVSYIINPDGTVSDISIKESTVNWPPLEEKVIKRIAHWKFPPSKSRKVRIVFPFLFFPSM